MLTNVVSIANLNQGCLHHYNLNHPYFVTESNDISLTFVGQRCAHHKSIYEEKVNKLCQYVNCDVPEVKELCPENCIGREGKDCDNFICA